MQFLKIMAVFCVLCMGYDVPGMASESASKKEMNNLGMIRLFDFEDANKGLYENYGSNVKIENGLLDVEVLSGDVQLIFPMINIDPPVKLQFKMKSGDGTFDDAEIYFRTKENQLWSEERKVTHPLNHDGLWHEYEVALPVLGNTLQFRIDPGWKKGHVQIDWVKVIKNVQAAKRIEKAKDRPLGPLSLDDESMNVKFTPTDCEVVVFDKRTQRQWVSKPDALQYVVVDGTKIHDRCFMITLLDLSTLVEYTCQVLLSCDGVLTFSLQNSDVQSRFHSLSMFPAAFMSDYSQGKIMFCNRSSGMYIDQTNDYKEFQAMPVYGNLSIDMPWVGVTDESKGDGFMLLVETPCDAVVVLTKDSRGRGWPGIQWKQSMDSFRYPRRLSYRFSPKGGYVSLAMMYRDYAAKTGKLVSLKEKAKQKPAVELLRGAPVIWGAVDAYDWVGEARTLGITRGVISNSQHGLKNDADLRKLNAMGYITNEYGNVGAILDANYTDFCKDSLAEAAYHVRPGLGPAMGWQSEGGPHYAERSSSKGLRAKQFYIPRRFARWGYNGRFVDAVAAMDLWEDWHPDHTFDRRQDMLYKRQIFDYLNGCGVVTGTEHGNDWVVDLIEYSEGSAGGSLWWNGGWNSAEIRKPKDPNVITSDYLKYGVNYENIIPLWQLVYHDCIVSTWYWADCQGFFYDVMPYISDRKDLFNILYGTVPLFWRDDTCCDWQKNKARFLRSYHETCILNYVVAFDRLTSHEFVSDDRAVQKTVFNSGTEVVVNFSDRPRDYNGIHLAERGFYVKGPNIYQARVVENGQTITHISAKDYFRAQSDHPARIGPAEISDGTVTVFRLDKKQWNIVLQKSSKCVLNLHEIMSLDTLDGCRIFKLNSKSEPVSSADVVVKEGKVVLGTDEDFAVFGIICGFKDTDVVILPQTEEIAPTQKIALFAEDTKKTINYTLDGYGSQPRWERYTKPFNIDKSTLVTAAVFDGDGNIVSKSNYRYRLLRKIYESPVLKAGMKPELLNIELSGYKKIVLTVDQLGAVPWLSRVNWIDAQFVDGKGNGQFIVGMAPALTLHDHTHLGINRLPYQEEGDPVHKMSVNGKVFENGMGTMAPCRIEYDIKDDYKYFKCCLAIDDSAIDKGRAQVVIFVEK